MKKKFNFNEFVWFLILLGFTLYFYRVLHTNKIVNFIHPDMIKYSYFALICLLILTLFQCSNIFSKRRSNKFRKGYILFFIPLFFGILVNPNGLDTNTVYNKEVSISKIQDVNFDKSIIKDGVINITSENYFNAYNYISENLNKYIGNDISVEGFIYKDSKFKTNEFVAARLLISCCAADGQVIGFLCQADNLTNLDKYKWVRVKGKIDKEILIGTIGQNSEVPVIKVSSIEYIDTPSNQYIYPQ